MDTQVQPKDIILIHIEGKPAFFARVEEILFDVKPGWRQIRFTVLTVPPQEITWILEPRQIDGDEFTMGGTPITIRKMADPVPSITTDEGEQQVESKPEDKPARSRGDKVISFPRPAKP